MEDISIQEVDMIKSATFQEIMKRIEKNIENEIILMSKSEWILDESTKHSINFYGNFYNILEENINKLIEQK